MKWPFFFRCVLPAAALAAMTACSPVPYFFEVEMKNGSQTATDLSGHRIAVLAMNEPGDRDSALVAAVAVGFAEKMEDIQQLPAGTVPVYTFPSDTVDRSDVGYIPYILPDEPADYLVVLDSLQAGDYGIREDGHLAYTEQGAFRTREVYLPFSLRFMVFDQQRRTCVLRQPVADSLYWTILVDGEVPPSKLIARAHEALKDAFGKVGLELTSYVSADWRPEERMLFAREGDPQWMQALDLAVAFRWEEASRIWLTLTGTGPLKNRAAAACNLAVACQMTGQFDLARQWMDLADALYELPESALLRAQIKRAEDRARKTVR